ncbi:hypothetical protein BDV29DRAFT_175701 [Aspergillus leporis]|uniref:Uncharacterized protein n=1 Tax=Aspergillus leporis TaxID=41062 RepID=A0A5N5X044_9EURO|nr:hypothetical protein BDV29DRAFT_175701 [Aspergillus leporis]
MLLVANLKTAPVSANTCPESPRKQSFPFSIHKLWTISSVSPVGMPTGTMPRWK